MSRVFEVRTYVVAPGKLDALMRRMHTVSLPLFAKHGMESVAYWTARGDETSGDSLVYVLAHQSRDAAVASWKAFQADQDWQQAKRASEVDGRLVHSITSWFGEAVSFSPIR